MLLQSQEWPHPKSLPVDRDGLPDRLDSLSLLTRKGLGLRVLAEHWPLCNCSLVNGRVPSQIGICCKCLDEGHIALRRKRLIGQLTRRTEMRNSSAKFCARSPAWYRLYISRLRSTFSGIAADAGSIDVRGTGYMTNLNMEIATRSVFIGDIETNELSRSFATTQS